MASFGVINAETPDTQAPMETTERPKIIYFGVFFDGTGNNMVQKETAKKYREQQQIDKNDDTWDLKLNHNLNKFGANDLPIIPLDDISAYLLTEYELKDISTRGSGYSNVAILHSVYQVMSDEQFNEKQKAYDIYRYNIYVEGAGTYADNDGSDMIGSGFGTGSTGVVALVSKAVAMVNTVIQAFKVYRPELHFDVFGFSRGATCARLFAFLVAKGDNEEFKAESQFKDYYASPLYKDGKLHFLEGEEFSNKCVDFLGIYDTVSSIGKTLSSYDDNLNDYGLYSPTLDKVKNTFHLCALDEFREHFALTDIGSAVDKEGNAELFIPGCHSDVGGTYMLQFERFSLIYRPALIEKNRMFVEKPHSRSGRTEELNSDTLLSLGWINSKDNVTTDWVTGYITCFRLKVLGGYSNIPLRMMVKRTEKITGFEKFSNFPAGRFDIPNLLTDLGIYMLKLAESKNGRYWYYPGGEYNSEPYKNLRRLFLHFSSTDTLVEVTDLEHTSLVHAPSKMGNVICRVLYSGNKGNSKRGYLCDYI